VTGFFLASAFPLRSSFVDLTELQPDYGDDVEMDEAPVGNKREDAEPEREDDLSKGDSITRPITVSPSGSTSEVSGAEISLTRGTDVPYAFSGDEGHH